jgi:hypothetical protein
VAQNHVQWRALVLTSFAIRFDSLSDQYAYVFGSYVVTMVAAILQLVVSLIVIETVEQDRVCVSLTCHR